MKPLPDPPAFARPASFVFNEERCNAEGMTPSNPQEGMTLIEYYAGEFAKELLRHRLYTRPSEVVSKEAARAMAAGAFTLAEGMAAERYDRPVPMVEPKATVMPARPFRLEYPDGSAIKGSTVPDKFLAVSRGGITLNNRGGAVNFDTVQAAEAALRELGQGPISLPPAPAVLEGKDGSRHYPDGSCVEAQPSTAAAPAASGGAVWFIARKKDGTTIDYFGSDSVVDFPTADKAAAALADVGQGPASIPPRQQSDETEI